MPVGLRVFALLGTEFVLAVPSKMLGIGPQICVRWQSNFQAVEITQRLLIMSFLVERTVRDNDAIVIV